MKPEAARSLAVAAMLFVRYSRWIGILTFFPLLGCTDRNSSEIELRRHCPFPLPTVVSQVNNLERSSPDLVFVSGFQVSEADVARSLLSHGFWEVADFKNTQLSAIWKTLAEFQRSFPVHHLDGSLRYFVGGENDDPYVYYVVLDAASGHVIFLKMGF